MLSGNNTGPNDVLALEFHTNPDAEVRTALIVDTLFGDRLIASLKSSCSEGTGTAATGLAKVRREPRPSPGHACAIADSRGLGSFRPAAVLERDRRDPVWGRLDWQCSGLHKMAIEIDGN